MVSFAFCPKSVSVKNNCLRRLDGASAEVPPVGRKQPGPAEHIARANRLDSDWLFTIAAGFDRHFPTSNQAKTIGRVAFGKDQFAGSELCWHGAVRQTLQMARTQVHKKRMLREHGCDLFHDNYPLKTCLRHCRGAVPPSS